MRKIQMRDRKKKHLRTAILHLNKNDFGIFEKKHQSISTIAKRKTWKRKKPSKKIKGISLCSAFFFFLLLYSNIYICSSLFAIALAVSMSPFRSINFIFIRQVFPCSSWAFGIEQCCSGFCSLQFNMLGWLAHFLDRHQPPATVEICSQSKIAHARAMRV